MSQLALTLPSIGQPNTTEDVDIVNAFTTIQTDYNGNIDENNLATAVKQKIGLSDGSVVRRGKSIIATSEARTNAAYGLLTTPDRVQNIVLTTDGLIAIIYRAAWQESVNAAARAAIFIGANQLKASQVGTAAPFLQETALAGGVNKDSPLATGVSGLQGDGPPTNAYTGDVTTGMLTGTYTGSPTTAHFGPCYVFVAAGTYDISVQFKASTGTVTANNRKLWVWTMAF